MSFPNFDLNLLLALNAVLTEGSVVKAANRLHVTPSAVSNALARLRILLGDPLVTKKGRGIVPTPRALELAPLLAKSLRELHHAVHSGIVPLAGTTRRFSIALSDAAQIDVLPRIAVLLAKEMPRARLRAIGIDALESLGGLTGPEVDVVLGPEQGDDEIQSEPLCSQPAVLICRRNHPAAAKAGRRGSTAGLRHVAIEMAAGHGLRDLAGLAYHRAGILRDVAISVPTFSAAAAVVASTDLVATVPERFYGAVGRSMRLRTLPLPIPELTIATNLCWHSRTQSDPLSAAFRNIVRQAAGRRRA
ncbi:MAG TPA: LysR family transcriptional regulator [Steroidobacteraceae bacterium]|nr:LysR family transcriptional regulator [Steroidobacteraceae bacterium]